MAKVSFSRRERGERLGGRARAHAPRARVPEASIDGHAPPRSLRASPARRCAPLRQPRRASRRRRAVRGGDADPGRPIPRAFPRDDARVSHLHRALVARGGAPHPSTRTRARARRARPRRDGGAPSSAPPRTRDRPPRTPTSRHSNVSTSRSTWTRPSATAPSSPSPPRRAPPRRRASSRATPWRLSPPRKSSPSASCPPTPRAATRTRSNLPARAPPSSPSFPRASATSSRSSSSRDGSGRASAANAARTIARRHEPSPPPTRTVSRTPPGLFPPSDGATSLRPRRRAPRGAPRSTPRPAPTRPSIASSTGPSPRPLRETSPTIATRIRTRTRAVAISSPRSSPRAARRPPGVGWPEHAPAPEWDEDDDHPEGFSGGTASTWDDDHPDGASPKMDKTRRARTDGRLRRLRSGRLRRRGRLGARWLLVATSRRRRSGR